MTPFDAQSIAAFIHCSAKNLSDGELNNSLCDYINEKADQILLLEDESDETWEAEKIRGYWEEKNTSAHLTLAPCSKYRTVEQRLMRCSNLLACKKE